MAFKERESVCTLFLDHLLDYGKLVTVLDLVKHIESNAGLK